MIYVMSDIHGQADAFGRMLDKINFSPSDELYILGDIIDRGPNSLAILSFIEENENVHLLMGNHEKMLVDFLDSVEGILPLEPYMLADEPGDRYFAWRHNGGDKTYAELEMLPADQIAHIHIFLSQLPKYFKIKVNGQNFLLCHARVLLPKDKTVDEALITAIRNGDIFWSRDMRYGHTRDDIILIHGHTPVQNLFRANTITKYMKNQIIDIDCGCAGARRLGCLRLDDMEEFYVECIKKR